jgi:hypothetical protein
MVAFNRNFDGVKIDILRSQFYQTMNFIETHYPRAFYRNERSRRVPRVRFEAVAVGTNLALRINPNLQVQSLDWLATDQFKELVRTDASNSGPKLRARIEYVRDNLLQQPNGS